MLLVTFCLLLVAAIGLWLLSLAVRDASIVDLCWGFGFVAIVWVVATALGFPSSRSWLITVIASIWGLRLTVYLCWRNIGSGEDFRYQEMREHWSSRFWYVSLFTVFLFQALIMWIVSWPLQMAAASEVGLWWLDGLGVLLWLTGLVFESIGDWQLARFKADSNNQGQVLDRGLWRYTRHPNYFGDCLVWWGFFLIAAAGGAWWTLISPVVMSLFLIKISGAKYLEDRLVNRRQPYQDYIARTSSFFPWPPKRI